MESFYSKLNVWLAAGCASKTDPLHRSKPTAHPVGTTVRVIDFLKHIPVRRQVVLKSATKILTKIKKLLQSYAIAQPEKRFSLKVLKAKNENNNWMYASTPGATLSDAASKIFGRELAASCILKDVTSKLSSFTGNHTEGDENTGSDEYHLVCFLPKADSGSYPLFRGELQVY